MNALLLYCFLLASRAPADLPTLADLGELKLAVAGTATVERVTNPQGNFLTAPPGFKLVVVTLKGTVPRACQIVVDTREFAAVFARDGTTPVGRTHQVRLSSAIQREGLGWTFPSPGTAATTGYAIRKAGPVVLRVAFIVPQHVSKFSVRLPTVARGQAVLSGRPRNP